MTRRSANETHVVTVELHHETDLKALRALRDAATPGKWEPYQHRETDAWSVAGEDTICYLWRLVEEEHTVSRLDNDEANAALIVAAVDALPALIDRLEAAEAALADARAKALEEAARIADEWTAADHIAQDKRLGIFPKCSPIQDAIATAIRALKGGPNY
jgi:hypothetical protein